MRTRKISERKNSANANFFGRQIIFKIFNFTSSNNSIFKSSIFSILFYGVSFQQFSCSFKIRPFFGNRLEQLFFFQKNRSLKKVTHSSFLCLSAHASPKALLPLRYLGPPTHKREIFPRYTYNSKSEYRIIIQRKNAGRKVGHGACGVILRNGVPHNW